MHFRVPIKPLSTIVFALSVATLVSGISFVPLVQASNTDQVSLDQYGMLTINSGWILLGQHLFWTSDSGQTWNEISPPIPSDASIQDLEFIDSNTGWMLWTTANSDGGANFILAHTADNGKTWAPRSLSLFESSDIASYTEKAEMGWFDLQKGWISIKQASGSNFSIGTLFTTSDGGMNWHRFALPVADQIYFSDPQDGWAVGGPAGDQIFNTIDAGATWKNVILADIPDGIPVIAYPPSISNGQGSLVITTQGAENNLKVYSLEDSDRWSPLGQIELDVEPGIIGLSILDAQNFVATIPGTSSIVRMENGELGVFENTDGLSASIVELDMMSLDVGWAKSVDSSCVSASLSVPEAASVSCLSSTRLLQTTNGGISWQSLQLPAIGSGITASDALNTSNTLTTSTISTTENTQVFIGQGFDRCEIPTLSQMQNWWNNSPYKTVNLYIGGSSRACQNSALTSSYLFQLNQQGWKFFPTWVGPQAPCTGYFNRISSDVIVAYDQGVSEANLAVDRLAELGLTGPPKTGSVVYYDIEYYGTNAACRAAVNAFMNGWVSQIRALGNLAGVYGSTLCNTGLSDFLTIENVPDVIWPARWYHNLGSGYYDPDASVWNLGSCVPNSAWSNHQRIRQYEGDHNETWGNLTLDIDSDVLDGVVAIPYDYPFVSSIVRADEDLTNATTVNFTVEFSKSVTGVNNADFAMTTSGVTGAFISTVSGSGTTYTVTVNTGTGDGSIRLNVTDNDSIHDASNNPLGGVGAGNGNYTSGPAYTIVKSSNVAILIGEELKGTYPVASSPSLVRRYPGTVNGPVLVASPNGGPIVTSQRAIYGSSFNELMGYPSNQFVTEYWFPWYDQVNMGTWILVGNPSSSQTAYVDIYIGGIKRNDTIGGVPYTIPAGDRITPQFPGVVDGPVRVVSVTGSGTPTPINIFASERSIYASSFNEVMGYPANQFVTEYWFPWYDQVNMGTWILVGNPSSSQTAYVDIYIGGVKRNDTVGGVPYAIPANGRITPQFPGVVDGPVRVVSVTGSGTPTPINIFTSERSIYVSSFSEVMGVPLNQFTTEYWYTWYQNNSALGTWILVGNPSSSQTAYVDIYIGGIKRNDTPGSVPYAIPANGRITPQFNLNTGPVRVVSVTGSGTPTPLNIFTSERAVYGPSFNEMMGYPANQLTTEYWFTWYDSTYMQTDILLSRP